jgi:transposase
LTTKRNLLKRAQKEEMIWNMHEDGHGVQKIAKVLHVSASTAHKVIKAHEKALLPKEKSKRSQALSHYEMGSTVLNVSVDLDIPVHEAEDYLIEFQRAIRIDYLEKLRTQIGAQFPQFVELAKELVLRDMSTQEMDQAKLVVKNCNEFQATKYLLQNEVSSLKISKNTLLPEIFQLRQESEKLRKSTNLASLDYAQVCASIENKKAELDDLEAILQSKIGTSELCEELDSFIKDRVEKTVGNQKIILISMVTAMAAVFASDRNGEFQSLLFQSEGAFFNPETQRKFALLVRKIMVELESQITEMQREVIYEQAKQIVKKLNS